MFQLPFNTKLRRERAVTDVCREGKYIISTVFHFMSKISNKEATIVNDL